MATEHKHSIGTTGRDYSTLQAWEDACPANLVTADEYYLGECYNDSEFTAALVISGETTDATRYIKLTVAAGQSFQDHADVRTNSLCYNQSNGVGVSVSVSWGQVFLIQCNYVKISRLQIRNTGTDFGKGVYSQGTYTTIEDCIVDVAVAGIAYYAVSSNAAGTLIVNPVIVMRGAGNGIYLESSTLVGAIIIKPSDVTPSGTGIIQEYNSTKILSSVILGFTTATAIATDNGSGYNATDLASGLPGSTANVYNVTYNQTTPFVDADKDSFDARAIAATALAAAGYRDSTNAPNDISGTARADPPTIGAWELAAAGSAIKTIFDLAKASVKTVNDLAIASVKSWAGLE